MFRQYSNADKKSCLKIFKSNVPLYFSSRETKEFEEWLPKMENYFVLEIDNKIIGSGGWFLKDEQTAGLSYGIIRKKYQKQGWGRILLNFRLEIIKARHPQVKKIEIDTSQKTAPFFEHFGFSTESVHPQFYGEGLDKYVMGLKLEA